MLDLINPFLKQTNKQSSSITRDDTSYLSCTYHFCPFMNFSEVSGTVCSVANQMACIILLD